MVQRKAKRKAPPVQAPPRDHTRRLNAIFLAVALVAGALAYWPALDADWFYDDADYIVSDPRLDHFELFTPGHWNDPPPKLDVEGIAVEQMPGYGKPVIYDRYLWRLSFALERRWYGSDDTAAVAHKINLAIHLICVMLLFFALRALLKLYEESAPEFASTETAWQYLPGLAALIFAIHPWTAEPVCYSTARSGSLGSAFALLSVICVASALRRNTKLIYRIALLLAVFLCAVAAYACKENFVSVLPGCVLVVAPILWLRARTWPKSLTLSLVVGVPLVLLIAVWIGIHASDRAKGLYEQASFERSWHYLFEIQSPLLLQTLADQLFGLRLSVEYNHPGWNPALCVLALALNAVLFGGAFVLGLRRPVWLGLAWFYLHMLPSNSVLPRQDFLAPRNVYLCVAGSAVLFSGGGLWLWSKLGRLQHTILAPGILAALPLYWFIQTHSWASAFVTPYLVWERSAQVAPDHATVRLNHAITMLSPAAHFTGTPAQLAALEAELNAALSAENSPTMQFHNPSHRATRRAVAYRVLGSLRHQAGKLPEAAAYFADSLSERPTLSVWVEWFEVALDGNLDDALNAAVAASAQHWPNDWWTRAARGLQRLKASKGKDTSAALPDLSAAQDAPDASQPDLRRVQIRVLYGTAKMSTDAAFRNQIADRLMRLGLSARDVKPLRQ